jgi:hypothetical protein
VAVAILVVLAWLDAPYSLAEPLSVIVAPVVVMEFARRQTFRVPWWAYPLAIFGIAAFICAVAVGPKVVQQHEEESGPTQHLALPEQIGDWQRDDSPQAKSLLAEARKSIDLPGLTDAAYRQGSGGMVLTVDTPAPDSELADQMKDPVGLINGSLKSLGLNTNGSFDPGRLGGWLGCGNATYASGATSAVCVWVGGHSIGVSEFVNDYTWTPDAAAQTREVRQLITTTR